MATYSIKPETLATISEAETVYAAILKSERSGRDTPEYRQQKDLYQRLVNNLRTQSITSIEGAVLTSDGTQVMSMNSLKLVDKGLSIESQGSLELTTKLLKWEGEAVGNLANGAGIKMGFPLKDVEWQTVKTGGGGIGLGAMFPFWVEVSIINRQTQDKARCRFVFGSRKAESLAFRANLVAWSIQAENAEQTRAAQPEPEDSGEPATEDDSSGSSLAGADSAEDLVSYPVTLNDLSGKGKSAPGIMTLRPSDFDFVGDSTEATEGDCLSIPLRAIETMRKGGGGLGFGLAKPFHIKINARLSDDPAASKTPLTVEFGTKRDQRDRVLALMGVRGAGSSGRGRSTSSPSGSPRSSVWVDEASASLVTPVRIQVDTTVKAKEGHTVFQITCFKELGGESWTVHKRYSEFNDLKTTLMELDARVVPLEFPQKKFMNDENTVTTRRNLLTEWSNKLLEWCPKDSAGLSQTVSASCNVALLNGHECVTSFFAPTADQMQMETVDGAFNFIARQSLLPKITVEFMRRTGGGVLKEGWMRKEGSRTGGWRQRYFVLWPKEAHPAIGRILAVFKDDSPGARPDSTVQILTPVIRAPKTPRPDYFCIRLNANRLLELKPMRTAAQKLILGFETEDEIREWIAALRQVTTVAAGLKDEVAVDPSCCGWLLKRSDGAITWWKKRWFELQGTQLIYWDQGGQRGKGEQREGSWNVENYELFCPVWPVAHREYEIILVASGYPKDQVKRYSQYFCADDEQAYNAWKGALGKVMKTVDDKQEDASALLQSVRFPKGGGVGMLRASASSGSSLDAGEGTPTISEDRPAQLDDGRNRPEDFDVQCVIGKGGFGKVLLVTNRGAVGAAKGKLLAMKIMSKEYLIQQQQVTHVKHECKILEEVKHPFIISLQYAFQNDTSLFLVLEFISGGDLYHHMDLKGTFTEEEACFISSELILALGYLHQRDIAFRDLKAENILLDEKGHVRLTDFGLAKPDMSKSQRETTCGTPLYMSPEAVMNMQMASVKMPEGGHAVGFEADWWALGAVTYEMLIGVPPFSAKQFAGLMKKISQTDLKFPELDRHKKPIKLSSYAKNFLNKIMDKDPLQRLGCTEDIPDTGLPVPEDFQLNDFFAKIDWHALLEKKMTPPYVPEYRPESPRHHFPSKLTDEAASEELFSSPSSAKPGAAPVAADFDGFYYDRDQEAAEVVEEEPAAGPAAVLEPESEPEPKAAQSTATATAPLVGVEPELEPEPAPVAASSAAEGGAVAEEAQAAACKGTKRQDGPRSGPTTDEIDVDQHEHDGDEVAPDVAPPTTIVSDLVLALRSSSAAGRIGRGNNNHLSELTSAALQQHPEIAVTLLKHGFTQGQHADQFVSELTTYTMTALADALAAHLLDDTDSQQAIVESMAPAADAAGSDSGEPAFLVALPAAVRVEIGQVLTKAVQCHPSGDENSPDVRAEIVAKFEITDQQYDQLVRYYYP